ncbi:histidine kinase [Pedobacter sp. HMWF019]|uniref:sensor histidine kinase n=1 Tax=Pedobacter sp. HMWF019 TaxID=2056856 RepID=UPI000D3AFC54|nr:HAMP domain-containing sensor histidine kinase [Pedobacter sp. HMWF019]PTS99585.1 histidine kinase [Pedobacter sp. HMWF019]
MDHQLKLYKKAAKIAEIGLWELDLPSQKLTWDLVTKQIFGVNEFHQPDLNEAMSYRIESPGLNRVEQLLQELTSDKETLSSEYKIKTTTGIIKWIESHTQAEFTNGICYKLVGTVQDITEQKELIESLRINQDKFHQAFDFAPIGMALVSPKGKWIKVNKSLCELLGYSEKELLRRSFQKLTHPEDLNLDLEYLQKVIQKKMSSYSMEKRYIHKTKEIVWVQLNVSLVWKDETPLYFVSQIKNITDRKQAEQEQKKTMLIINDQNNRLVNFAHIVSHNLRSHSSNFQMMLKLLAESSNEEEKKEIITLLLQNADHLSETIDNLDEVVKIQLNSHQQKKALNLEQEIKKVLLSIKAIAEEQKSSFSLDVHPDLFVFCNPAYLDSILLNILTNAIKYRSPNRTPEIRIKVYSDQSETVLEIADNGIGIDLKRHKHDLFGMYKTFHQNKDARGIGLFITKNQVEAQGGRIDVESQVDNGTTFRVYFPETDN